MRKLHTLFALALAAVLAFPSAALAHDDGGLEGVEEGSYRHQHGESDGHLPGVQRNVEVVGRVDLFTLLERPGRVSDVAAFGNYAYLGAFHADDCAEPGGVFVIDISVPQTPREVSFIPADPYTYVGEGVQILDLKTASFSGQVLIHNNETCVPAAGPTGAGTGGGTSMWDVTDPLNPKPLALHFGEGVSGVAAHQSHSAFGWQQGDRAYVVQVDNDEFGDSDIDIWDITNPATPQLVAETGLADFPEILETPAPNGNAAFLHDMVVKQVGTRWILLGSYWDGGYIQLDVTNLPAKPTLVGDTDFGAVEPFAAQLGLPADWTPEGNAHQAEFSARNDIFLGADEDFGPYRPAGTVATGRYAGHRFSAVDGNAVPPMPEMAESPSQFVGSACAPLPPAPSPDHVAIVERGVCTFSIKASIVTAAGYKAGLVFNDQATDPNCDSTLFMLAVGTIPFAFVQRSAGLKLLDVEFTDPCATPTPAVDLLNPLGERLTFKPYFDGWGYLHAYDAKTRQPLAHWALPESLDPAHAAGSGDLSIHEVATDHQKNNRAYLSHYSGGFRVVQFGKSGIKEIGAFIPEGGTNMWGVEVHYMPGSDEAFVLASDRDAGLWILRYNKGAAGNP